MEIEREAKKRETHPADVQFWGAIFAVKFREPERGFI